MFYEHRKSHAGCQTTISDSSSNLDAINVTAPQSHNEWVKWCVEYIKLFIIKMYLVALGHSRLIPMYNACFILWPPSPSTPIRKKFCKTKLTLSIRNTFIGVSCIDRRAALLGLRHKSSHWVHPNLFYIWKYILDTKYKNDHSFPYRFIHRKSPWFN